MTGHDAGMIRLTLLTHSGLVGHSPFILAALMIGSHFSNSPL
jgi:hypothetical protein